MPHESLVLFTSWLTLSCSVLLCLVAMLGTNAVELRPTLATLGLGVTTLLHPPPPPSKYNGFGVHLKKYNNSSVVRAVLTNSTSSIGSNSTSTVLLNRIPLEDEVVAYTTTHSTVEVVAKALIRIRKEFFINWIKDHITFELISEDIDHDTKRLKRVVFCLKKGLLPMPLHSNEFSESPVDFIIPQNFGNPGAIIITNRSKELYLLEIVVKRFNETSFVFPVNTWIHSQKQNSENLIVFRNHAYLPSQTPAGIQFLREHYLSSSRGNGTGERMPSDRIYDYDVYNDLGDPDKAGEYARPCFGGKERPYPRRMRTGRPPTKSDLLAESRPDPSLYFYVPPDHRFETKKQDTFKEIKLKARLRCLRHSIFSKLLNAEAPFKQFSDIDNLYQDGGNGFLKSIGQSLLKYSIPAIVKHDKFAWMRDTEFARRFVAGINPVQVESLKKLPIKSELDPSIYGPPESAITKEFLEKELNGITVDEAIKDNRLFIIDYHDMLLPFIEKINLIPGRKAYASRTILFNDNTGILRPIAIELSLPESKRVYTPGDDTIKHWKWKMAIAHVSCNDADIHQLGNHWLRTHACVEPYIIATHRQLSPMHPIFKLLHPHLRYTLQINAVSRQRLICGNGIIEDCFCPGKYAMELSSSIYKNNWQFNTEALPEDLVQRGMAFEDPTSPCGVKLVLEDYPYAADGLLIWSAIKDWVGDFVEHFYCNDQTVVSDIELKSWWDEIKNKAHADKRNEPWWPNLNTREDLTHILTTIIWVASCQHAALNFGQFPLGGYVPYHPAIMRKLIPEENDQDYRNFIENPQSTFLSSLPTQFQASKLMGVQENLSTHSPDEEYLGQSSRRYRDLIDDDQVLKLFSELTAKLDEIEGIIHKRNRDERYKNRGGAGIPYYELLVPSSEPGATGRGIPNSASI